MGRSATLLAFTVMWLTSIAAAEYNSTTDSGQLSSRCFPGSGSCNEGRTFGVGHRRRMTMMLLPVMFKLGVIVTLLVTLTALAFKGIGIGVILLVFAFGGLFSKLKSPDRGHRPVGPPVHVHVHDFENSHKHHPPSYSYSSDYSGASGWDRTEESAAPSWADYMGRSTRSRMYSPYPAVTVPPNKNWLSKFYRQ